MSTQWTVHLTTHSFQSLNNDSSTNKPGQVFNPCDNPENLINKATADRVMQAFYLGFFPLVELFGVTTNVINCVVFARQGLKDRINLCLFSLALSDITFLVLIFFAKFFNFLGLFDKELRDYWEMKHLETVLGPMLGSLSLSNLLTMIISVERCICVVSPFTAKKFLKTRYMAVIIVVTAIYSLGLYSVQNLQYTTQRITDAHTNTSYWVIQLTDMVVENHELIEFLHTHLLSLTIPCLSLVVVIVTTSITVFKLRKAVVWRHESVNSAVSETDGRVAVTKMLTVVRFIYVTTITPSVTQAFVRTLIPDYLPTGVYCNTFDVVQTLAHVCEVTNSSVNFIVYFTMGSRFRDTVRQLLATRSHRKHSPVQSFITVSQDL